MHIQQLHEKTIIFQDLLKNGAIQTESEYLDLIEVVNQHNHLYYRENNPIISDSEYDLLFQALVTYEEEHHTSISSNSPTQQLNNQDEIQTSFEKSQHQYPILSLQNTYSKDDIASRCQSNNSLITKAENNTQPINYTIEPKYDGLSIILTYQNGKLIKAVTRGDGYIGDNVTTNVKTIKNIPHTIPVLDKLIVRGEIMMPKSTLQELNYQRQQSGENIFSNTRNAAAGSLKLFDTKEVKKRGLICYVYEVIEGDQNALEYFEQLKPFTKTINKGIYTEDELYNIIDQQEDIINEMSQYDCDFDGLVIKIIDLGQRHFLGTTNHHPRRAIAYKFPTQQASVQIQSIERQVGRTGILTPVAHITPTILGGVTISRVSLHNRDFITTKDIKINDRVWLQRSGEVIPYIVSVINQRRNGNEINYTTDQVICPDCNTPATISITPSNTTQCICSNNNCPGIFKEKIKHFVSKQAMNMNSIGNSFADLLVDQQLIHHLSNLYTLTQSEQLFVLKRLPGLGNKKIEIMIDEITASKITELRRFLHGLSIVGIGIKVAKDIQRQLGFLDTNPTSITEIFATITQAEFLTTIYGIGDKTINEFQKWYSNPENQQELARFEAHGLQLTYTHQQATTTKAQSICITGTFPIPRSELEFHIKQAGFEYHSSLTKHTDYLLVGSNAGSKKDKIGPHTKVLTNTEEIYSLLKVSAPLFEEHKHPDKKSGGTMQSLFG